ncbi:MAG: hypothetical protein AB7H77_03010 [Bdellovibrionales bacterium]
MHYFSHRAGMLAAAAAVLLATGPAMAMNSPQSTASQQNRPSLNDPTPLRPAAPNYRQYRAPRIEGQNGISYVSGGIGEQETDALESQASNYNLRLISSDKDGAYVPDTDLVIKSREGGELISVKDAGPLFYAKLPPGQYVVEAAQGSARKERNITIRKNSPATMHLVWENDV